MSVDVERPDADFGLVEGMVAAVILAFGLLAVAGVTLAVGSLTAQSTVRTDQSLAARQVLEGVIAEPYGTYPAGTSDDTTVTVRGRSFLVSREITAASDRVDEVEVVVEGLAGVPPDSFHARIYEPVPPP